MNNPFISPLPYQQPMYGAGMYPQINYTQAPFRNILPGKSVDKPEDAGPGDVPTDGSIAVFPKSDGSCIYVKHWTPEGSIKTLTYVPQGSSSKNNSEGEKESVSMEDIYNLLSSMNDLLNNKNYYRKTKRGSNNQNTQTDQNESKKEVIEND